MKRWLIGSGAGIALIVVALLVAPLFIDVNAYRGQAVADIKRATGRDIVLGGPISLRLLPWPTVRVEDVKVQNLPGAKNPDMVTVKSITVTPSLWALLGGTFEVSDVALQEPKIVLEVNSEGKPNWELTPSVAEAKPVAAKPSMPVPLSVGIDHVFCHISFSPRGTAAIDAITRLAAIHGLAVYDPQSDEVHRPAR